jgi:hypothetical protein
MDDQDQQSSATRFLDAHPELREAMRQSEPFSRIRDQSALRVDEETQYIVRDDTLGGEDDLFLDALARGSAAQDDDDYRALYLGLDESLRSLVNSRLRR